MYRKPSYDQLRVFESLWYAHDQGKKCNKFASRNHRCIFIGYPHGKKGWKFYYLEKRDFFYFFYFIFFLSMDVDFSKNEFPFTHKANHDKEPSTMIEWAMAGADDDEEYVRFKRHVWESDQEGTC